MMDLGASRRPRLATTRVLSWVVLSWTLARSAALVVPLGASRPGLSLSGVSVTRVETGASSSEVDLGATLGASSAKRTFLVLGTYPGDFNMIEYAQKLRHFRTKLTEKGVDRICAVVNGAPASCLKLAELLDLPPEIELYSDPKGEAGRRFGVSRGWRPDDDGLNPYLKLYLMLFGIGPPQTLPAVITGYLGNPWGKRAWIETALAQGQAAKRWPDTVLDAQGANNFDALPVVGTWGRRPLELATLRLQNLKMAFDNWEALKPTDDRCLTQLGGCAVVGPDGDAQFAWIDNGICDVPDFDDILNQL